MACSTTARPRSAGTNTGHTAEFYLHCELPDNIPPCPYFINYTAQYELIAVLRYRLYCTEGIYCSAAV